MVSIDQNEKVSSLIKQVSEMTGINFVGTKDIEGEQFELTKVFAYVQKDAKKNMITLLFEEPYTLSEIGVMDRTDLILTELLTDMGKKIIQRHHANEYEYNAAINAKDTTDTALMKSKISYENYDEYRQSQASTLSPSNVFLSAKKSDTISS